MDMRLGAAALAVVVITCVAGCATEPIYVPPAAGEPQATIREQYLGVFSCTHARIRTIDDHRFPMFNHFNGRGWHDPAARPISPGVHSIESLGGYGAFIVLQLAEWCWGNCRATLRFTAEPSHAYQLALIKEGDPYRIDLIDSETNQSVASAPCNGSGSKREQPPAPEPDTGTSSMESPH